ncbi:unnamed protein product [Caenorhabditis sp. 36 PRJEB53466]|nr:unnamed protein product [Caenorhabditis sp. 36 PRJEB53466]
MADRRGGGGQWQPREDNKWRPYGGGGGWRGNNRGGNPRGSGGWRGNQDNWRGGGGGRGFPRGNNQNRGGWNRGGGGFRGGRGGGPHEGPIDAKRCIIPSMWANPWLKLEAEYEKEYGIAISEVQAIENQPENLEIQAELPETSPPENSPISAEN